MSVMHKQIKNLFTNPQKAMSNGLWFSGYENEGEYKEWYSNGQLWVSAFYKDGKLDGEFKSWYRNGQFFQHCLYKDGKLVKDYLE